MNEKTLKRKLIAVNYDTGSKGRFAEIEIGGTLTCKDSRTGENITDQLNGSYWHPLDVHGLPIDGIINIKIVTGIWSIVATTSARNVKHPEFMWLLNLAKELQSNSIGYVPYLRKDTTSLHSIIDTIRIPIP